jgi:hypothetical protein
LTTPGASCETKKGEMDSFERERRRLVDGLVRNLMGLYREVVKSELVEMKSSARTNRQSARQRAKAAKKAARAAARLARQEARQEARQKKREARAAERAERERLRLERRTEREAMREELRKVRELQRARERHEREQRRGASRRQTSRSSELLGSDVLRPNTLFVHKRKTDGSIQPLVRGEAPSAPPPPAE